MCSQSIRGVPCAAHQRIVLRFNETLIVRSQYSKYKKGKDMEEFLWHLAND